MVRYRSVLDRRVPCRSAISQPSLHELTNMQFDILVRQLFSKTILILNLCVCVLTTEYTQLHVWLKLFRNFFLSLYLYNISKKFTFVQLNINYSHKITRQSETSDFAPLVTHNVGICKPIFRTLSLTDCRGNVL